MKLHRIPTARELLSTFDNIKKDSRNYLVQCPLVTNEESNTHQNETQEHVHSMSVACDSPQFAVSWHVLTFTTELCEKCVTYTARTQEKGDKNQEKNNVHIYK